MVVIGSGRSKISSPVVMLVVAVFALAGAVTAVARTSTAVAAAGSVVAAAAVEDEGADCPVSLPGSLPANAKLPDPFKRIDGTRISSKSDWRCRRAEIKKLAERYVYGEKPGKPASVTGTVSGTGITVNVSHNGKSSSFSAKVELRWTPRPSGRGGADPWTVSGTAGSEVDERLWSPVVDRIVWGMCRGR